MGQRPTLVRYADDFVVLARFQGPRLTGWIAEKIEGWMGLELSREKTQVIDLREKGQSVDFLGYTFRFDRSLYGEAKKPYLNARFPRRKRSPASAAVCASSPLAAAAASRFPEW